MPTANTNKRGVEQPASVQCTCACGCTTPSLEPLCTHCGNVTCMVCQAKYKHKCCPDMELQFWPGFMKAEVTALRILIQAVPMPKYPNARTGVASLLDSFARKYHTTPDRVLKELTLLDPPL